MSLPFGLNTWSLWRHGEGQAEFRVGLPGAAPQVPWASVLVRWLHLPWSDWAPLLPSSGQSVVPEPKDEVEACEGGSAHLPPQAGPRGWGLCRLSKFRVRFSREQKKKKTEDWAPYQWPLPQSHLNLLPLSQGSLSTLHSDSWTESWQKAGSLEVSRKFCPALLCL